MPPPVAPVAPPVTRPAPEVTVVLTASRTSRHVGRALASLAGQTVGRDAFEVVLVRHGSPGDDPAAGPHPGDGHPDLVLRRIDVTEAGTARARNLGIAAARGRHVTFLDDDDRVSPGFLAGLLAAAAPGVLPTTSGTEVPSVLALAGATLVPTSIARRVEFPAHLSRGSAAVFWANVCALTHASLRVVPHDAGAVYVRGDENGPPDAPDYDREVTSRLDCLRELGAVPVDAPSTGRLVAALATHQSGFVNDWLLAHPEDHARVRADVARHDVRLVDWSRVNRGLAEDIAVVYTFPPYVDTSAIVAARRIREHGAVTDLITKELDDIRQRDDGSSRVAAEFIGTRSTVPGKSAFSAWGPVESFSGAALDRFRELEESHGPYRRLYSRSQWAASTIAAARIKLLRPELHWHAEFSDPLLFDIQGRVRGREMAEGEVVAALRAGIEGAGFAPPAGLLLFEWCERLVYALADEILFTNENQRRYMLDYCADPAAARRAGDISTVSHHPTLPSAFYRMAEAGVELEPGVVHLAYFGVFYPTRGLTEVTEGLALLEPGERSRLRLHVFTSAPDDVAVQVREAGLADVVEVAGYRPFLDFLSLTTVFDVLVVNDAATVGHHRLNPYLPSKLSDYLGSGRPIWSITEPGSVLSTLETAHTSTVGDAAGAAAVLRSLASALPGGGQGR